MSTIANPLIDSTDTSSSQSDKNVVSPPALSFKDTSMQIIGFVTFVGDASRGILFPALWPLCQHLGGTKLDLGFLVSIFSFGRYIIAKRLGIIADVYRHRASLMISGVIFILGGIFWSISPFASTLPLLYIAQFTLGLGTGSLGVTRSYVVEQTTPQTRTYMLAYLTMLQYGGFTVTPLIGALLVVIGGTISESCKYAFPAIMVLLLAIVSTLMLVFIFKDFEVAYEEPPAEVKNKEALASKNKNDIVIPAPRDEEGKDGDVSMTVKSYIPPTNSMSTPIDEESIMPPEKTKEVIQPSKDEQKLVFQALILLNFTQRGLIAIFEVQGSAILLDTYNLSEISLGIIVTMAGIIGTIQCYKFRDFWTKKFTNWSMMFWGVFTMILSQLSIIYWGKGTSTPLWVYIIALYSVYSFGYPVGNSAALGSFSMVQKAGRMAKAQSQFSRMGSAARVIMPVLSEAVTQYVQDQGGFSVGLFMMAITLIGMLLNYNKILFYTVGHDSIDDSFANLSIKHKGFLAFCFVCIVISIGSLASW